MGDVFMASSGQAAATGWQHKGDAKVCTMVQGQEDFEGLAWG